GGECELQDLAMGYGRSVSRFTERKRVVKDKNLGPLVSTDMTRCIHCTRCVRFLEEIAGTAELGGIGRGENTEISTFIERNIDSELSGNIIDLCPVGALTNKPFRFSARAWEMTARPYIGTHDCVGSNLFYHVRGGTIMRSVPRDNEAVNECWLPDRDRYSHFGLQSDDRVKHPRIKQNGEWRDVDWETALEFASSALASVASQHGADQIGVLASPRATTEEHFLLKKLADGLGTPHTDHRLRIVDDSDPRLGSAYLYRPMEDLSKADAVFMVGSHLSHDQPILNHRVRTAWRTNQAKVMDLNPVAWDFPFDLTNRLIVPPQHLPETLARVAAAAYALAGKNAGEDQLGQFISSRSAETGANTIVENLQQANQGFLILGDQALQHPQAGLIRALAERIANELNIALMALPGAANSQGAFVAGMIPGNQGLSAHAMLNDHRRAAYLIHDFEPAFDTVNPVAASKALNQAEMVIALTSFAGPDLLEAADVILPLAAVPETDGSYVNADGQRQWLKAAAKPVGEARPGWKILRMLGDHLKVDGFEFTHLSEVENALDRQPAPEFAEAKLDVRMEQSHHAADEFWRIGAVPMYRGDGLVRRSEALQKTDHSQLDYAVLHPSSAEKLSLNEGDSIHVAQAEGKATLRLEIDAGIPPGAVWLPAASDISTELGSAFGPIQVERSA
ncbi:MAG: molybdopterin-dependent oxidoreductase, partial [Pseudomonadota bacterium]